MTTYYCTQCKKLLPDTSEAQRYRFRKTGLIFCNNKICGFVYRTANRKERQPPERPKVTCHMCAETADLSGHRHSQWKRTGRAYCSLECSLAYRAKRSSETMSKTNRVYASDRMKRNNPMQHAEIRARMSDTLRTIGHQPKERGGNGKTAPVPEQMLELMFGSLGFIPQLAIKTGWKKGNGIYPVVYKPDLGNPTLKIAIEADGNSHLLLDRRKRDQKKDEFLRGLGWTVLRFSNREILTEPMRVLETVMSTISKSLTSTPT